jgi:type I restriction enzyme M protein
MALLSLYSETVEAVAGSPTSSSRLGLKDESLDDSTNLPDPDVIAAEIAEDLEAALLQFSQIAADLKK